VIVRWGLAELPGVLDDVGIDRPLLVASERWDRLEIPAPHRWTEIPSDRITVPPDVDGVLAVGGGSAIDTAKAASAASELPLVSVPTTYSGAEWTGFFGVRTPERLQVGGGSCDAGRALAERGLYLGHAMAQAVGGRYGVPHGASNALCLPPAMRFNAPVVPWAMTAIPVERVEELARLAGFERLRDLGVPEEDLDEVGAAAAQRPGAKANPRPASAAEIAELYRSVW
jgi:alcohol dehydrogenase class IV